MPDRFQRFLHHREALLGLVLILLWGLVALLAPLIAPHDPLQQNLRERLASLSWSHPFGTDELGRDVFSRVLYGARISLPVGFLIILLAALVGGSLGAVAGYVGGLLDDLVMRVADVTLAFPSIVLALAIAAVLGPGLGNALIAMAAVWWPEYARLMRAQVLTVKVQEYILAAKAVGVPERRILLRHVLPNSIVPLFIKGALDIGNAILFVAALSFIGLGAVPPTPEWGAMIALGRNKFYQWWIATFPGLAIVSVVVGFNLLGDGLRDLLDPRHRAGRR